MHGQINLVKFIESSKTDNVCSKIWHIFVWSDQFDQMFYFIKLIWWKRANQN